MRERKTTAQRELENYPGKQARVASLRPAPGRPEPQYPLTPNEQYAWSEIVQCLEQEGRISKHDGPTIYIAAKNFGIMMQALEMVARDGLQSKLTTKTAKNPLLVVFFMAQKAYVDACKVLGYSPSRRDVVPEAKTEVDPFGLLDGEPGYVPSGAIDGANPN